MDSDFEPPSPLWLILSTVGGIATAIAAIVAFEIFLAYWNRLHPVKEVHQSTAIPSAITAPPLPLLATVNPSVSQSSSVSSPFSTTPQLSELHAVARPAWQYFSHNWNQETGLVNSVDGFASVTLWDQAAAMAALVSTTELGLIPTTEFEAKLSQMLTTLATLPLYRNELPNKVYNAKTLLPVNYGQLTKRQSIGWSAIDIGRLALWLKIVGTRYPKFQSQTEAVWQHWQVKRLTKGGQLFGTSVINGRERYNQEGRLGYESYAAFGLHLWGLDVNKAMDTKTTTAFVRIYGQDVPYDKRDYKTSRAHNYVLSEPYILDGIETGFQALPKTYADRVLAVQSDRYNATQHLTALSEDNLDRPPYFVYNTVFVNGQPWATITDAGDRYDKLRFLSTKAAIGWHVLYNTPYTQQLVTFVQQQLQTKQGWYNGFYESLQTPNQALTANNNGVILESLLYQYIKQPLIHWAGIIPPQ